MNKLLLKSMGAAIVCITMAACNDVPSNSNNNSDIPSDGILGEYGPYFYDMMTEIDITIPQAIKELIKKGEEEIDLETGKTSDEIGKQYKELNEKREALQVELKQKVQEASAALQGKEITTLIEDGAPLKIVEPFKIKKLSGSLQMECECIVELTKESPADYIHKYNGSMLMKAECKNDSDEIVSAYRKNTISIVGGSWPDDVYPAGTQFIIKTEVSAGYTSEGISKGLFQIHHLTVCWSANHFVLENRKLGPVEIDKPISNLPQSVAGLYDKFEHKIETHEDEMDGEWVEEYYLFTKDGKKAFRINIIDDVAYDICLLEGSTNIKDRDGIYVGYSARKLFIQKKMDWENDYAGWVYGKARDYTYYIKTADLVNPDSEIPYKAEDIKEDAKIIRIDYR
ncbi:hypothetical protein [Xylanibacter brevis]|uniref:hypothetical protein n=1 Tax=Xylanibacter brevis TaxID=83231 RepID=UPI000AFC7A15|nr:hypothetical protein [Xylanibacter brevis]